MEKYQGMRRNPGGTQTSASHRVGTLNSQGHHLNIDSTPEAATITITRKEGYAHHITIKTGDLPEHTRNSAAFRRHPQSVLISHAIHAIANWSKAKDTGNLSACLCGTGSNVTACYNLTTKEYDWYCPTCFYGEAA